MLFYCEVTSLLNVEEDHGWVNGAVDTSAALPVNFTISGVTSNGFQGFETLVLDGTAPGSFYYNGQEITVLNSSHFVQDSAVYTSVGITFLPQQHYSSTGSTITLSHTANVDRYDSGILKDKACYQSMKVCGYPDVPTWVSSSSQCFDSSEASTVDVPLVLSTDDTDGSERVSKYKVHLNEDAADAIASINGVSVGTGAQVVQVNPRSCSNQCKSAELQITCADYFAGNFQLNVTVSKRVLDGLKIIVSRRR